MTSKLTTPDENRQEKWKKILKSREWEKWAMSHLVYAILSYSSFAFTTMCIYSEVKCASLFSVANSPIPQAGWVILKNKFILVVLEIQCEGATFGHGLLVRVPKCCRALHRKRWEGSLHICAYICLFWSLSPSSYIVTSVTSVTG